MTPQYGSIAFCSRGNLGLILVNAPQEVTYPGGAKAMAWTGIHLRYAGYKIGPGDPWSSRNPQVVAHTDQFIFKMPGETLMLKDQLDWDRIMVAPRYAGGHESIMEALFKDAKVLASWVEDDYQGSEAFAYQLADGRYVCLTDSFGSCSGCDSWEDATDEDCRNMCIQLANNAHVFDTLPELIQFIEGEVPSDPAAYFHDRDLNNLLPALKQYALAA